MSFISRLPFINKRKNRLKEEEAVSEVMAKAGWSREETEKKLSNAKERLGITYTHYNKYDFHTIPEELQQGVYQSILNRISYQNEKKAKVIAEVMKKTGWSEADAKTRIKEATKRFDITYGEYLKYEFYCMTEKEQQKRYDELVKEKQECSEAKKENRQKERDEVIKTVMEKTGWDYVVTKEKIEEAKKRTGCTYNEYLMYQFYDLEASVQDEIFLMSLSKKIYRKYTANREFGKMLCDKAATNQFFAECIRRPWCMNTDVSFEEFKKLFIDSQKIVYKPLSGNWGRGVLGFEVDEKNIKEVYDEIISFPEGVVEQFVRQHPRLNELSPTAVNTVRLVTVSSNTRPVSPEGNMLEVAYASLKIGGVTSTIVDNLHGGGMVAAIDMEKGELKTNAADEKGNVYEVHPLTGTTIKGFKVPCFEEAVEMVTKAIVDKKLEGYLGWDVAISEDGPVLIEVNLRPGVILLTMPYIAEKRGMKKWMERYY